jgi:hypothetical protein
MTFWKAGRNLPSLPPTPAPRQKTWFSRLLSKWYSVKQSTPPESTAPKLLFGAMFKSVGGTWSTTNLEATDIYDVLSQLSRNPNVDFVVEVRTQNLRADRRNWLHRV